MGVLRIRGYSSHIGTETSLLDPVLHEHKRNLNHLAKQMDQLRQGVFTLLASPEDVHRSWKQTGRHTDVGTTRGSISRGYSHSNNEALRI